MNASLPDAPLRPNRPDVIDETFDGEAVLVNLQSGCYYALSPAATALWNLIADGRSAASLAASTDCEPQTILDFIANFEAEGLLAAADADAGPATEPVAVSGDPTLEKFTDMQELLLMDPIHDVALDADGWPVAAPE